MTEFKIQKRYLSRQILKKSSHSSLNVSQLFILAGTLLLLISFIALAVQLQPYFENVHTKQMSNIWEKSLIIISTTLLLLKLSFLVYLLVLHLKYRAVSSVEDEELPSCTVIVPAYNEGELVYKTLQSLINSDYPKDKLQILTIDDGSQDDTWQWMLKAKQEFGERISIFQQPENKGKRHALYRGFQIGRGEIFITVDSDSVVKSDTLRNMVSPFVKNDKCGAVAGNVRVLNSKNAIIPKMLNVSFAFSFEFVRSAQSTAGTVMCTPGALAAYRKDVVMNCLPQWIAQKFMGQTSDIGEDRAMTNMILKQGFQVVFQKNAVVYTNTPENFKGLSKMYIRWGRSNVREDIMMSKFAFGNFREGEKTSSRIFLLNQWMTTILSFPMLAVMFYIIASYPLLFLCSAMTGIFLFSSMSAFFYAKRRKVIDAIWAYSYGVFYTFCLFWITPYAIATVGKRGWLTRDLSVEQLKAFSENRAKAA
ncbi:MAG: glycosyltransferase family 2 protein [Flavobacteriia bacterium]|nr:glycosyltransferase family 2 protein [Flavobacteriia bacterium]